MGDMCKWKMNHEEEEEEEEEEWIKMIWWTSVRAFEQHNHGLLNLKVVSMAAPPPITCTQFLF
jgi:hypothetical protein